MSSTTRLLSLGTMTVLAVFLSQQPASGAEGGIAWDAASVRLVQPGGCYGRMTRIGGRRILLTYEQGGEVQVRHSADDGMTWEAPILAVALPGSQIANAEMLPLRDGTLLLLTNERPGRPAPGEAASRPYRILVSRSADGGHAWSTPLPAYTGGTRFTDGCWEPAAVQLSSGEIHLYFANETPYPDSDEQEIGLLRSQDGGVHWNKAERVIFRPRHRDGMPAPLLLPDGRTMAVAIEDNGLSGTFKPAIIRNADNWSSGAVLGDQPPRRSALTVPLPAKAYAGAPCLRQLPDGRTLLSCQESPSGALQDARMAVRIGDPDADGFGMPSHPFPDHRPQLWNALFIKGPAMVTAITTATLDGRQGIWAVDGIVNGDRR